MELAKQGDRFYGHTAPPVLIQQICIAEPERVGRAYINVKTAPLAPKMIPDEIIFTVL
jgi:hypothetical protein